LGLGLFRYPFALGLGLIAVHKISDIHLFILLFSQMYCDDAHIRMGHSIFTAQILFDPADLLLFKFTDLKFTHFNSQTLYSLND
jgi:hypothetical protein